MKYDLIVVGGGPAGYVAAIRAAQLGKNVVCVDKERAGGTCLNWGCIPTKALLKNTELYWTLKKDAENFGLKIEGLSYDWSKVVGRSRGVADKLAGGIEFLFKKNKVKYVLGEAELAGGGLVKVKKSDGSGEETLEGERVMIATGCVSRGLPGLPFDGKRVIGSRQAMALATQPKDIVIIGAGAIGMEFAYFFNAFGTKVTVLEALPRVLPVEDEESSAAVEKAYAKLGVRVLTGTKSTATKVTDKGVEITVEGKASETIRAELALVAIGVAPLLPGGLQPELTERGYVKVGDRYETSLPGVFATGDITGPPSLAHVASFEAVQAVEGMFVRGHVPRKLGVFPGCTYCQPQVASVGLTEAKAKELGRKFRVGKFPLQASGKALASGDSEGFVKILVAEPYGEIIGAHIVGHEATEMIAEMGLAISMEATHEDIEATIHAHPTLSEALHEATAAAFGHAIHI